MPCIVPASSKQDMKDKPIIGSRQGFNKFIDISFEGCVRIGYEGFFDGFWAHFS